MIRGVAIAAAAVIGLSAWHLVSVERAKAEVIAGESLRRLTCAPALNAEAKIAKAESPLVQAVEALGTTLPEHAAIVVIRRGVGEPIADDEQAGVVVFIGEQGQGLAPIRALEQTFLSLPEIAEGCGSERRTVVLGAARFTPSTPTSCRSRSGCGQTRTAWPLAMFAAPLNVLLDLLATAQLPSTARPG